MGYDIILVVETRKADGAWSLTASASGSFEDWYEVRNYECFSLLTGHDFSKRLVRPATPVAQLRGWPRDMASETVELLYSPSDRRSWLSSRDFATYDWDAPVERSFFATPPAGQALDAGNRKMVREYVRKNGRPPKGWTISGWSRDGFQVTGSVARRQLAGLFIDQVVKPLRELSGSDPDSARCVFGFVH